MAFQWDTQREKAASLLAASVAKVEAGRQCGVTEQTIHNWCKSPEFNERVVLLAKEYAAAVKQIAIANRTVRIAELADLARRMRQIITGREERTEKIQAQVAALEKIRDTDANTTEERLAAASELNKALDDIHGGEEAGLLARDYRQIGGGDNAYHVKIYRFDSALVKEYREVLKQVAIEVGEWTEVHELIGTPLDDLKNFLANPNP